MPLNMTAGTNSWNSGGQVGVTGCGKKAVYVYSSAGWVANTDLGLRARDPPEVTEENGP